jgi:hypothetical protein
LYAPFVPRINRQMACCDRDRPGRAEYELIQKNYRCRCHPLSSTVGGVAIAVAIAALVARSALAVETESYVVAEPGDGRFALVSDEQAAPLLLSDEDYPGVIRVARHLQADIERVTTKEPEIITGDKTPGKQIILIGTLGKNSLIDRLVREKKIDVVDIADRWETYLVTVVERPFDGVDRALVIAGSDKRGTIFGMFDLSAQIGVSPWYFWADVPVEKRSSLYVLPGRHTRGEPAVKYRGIFINDEAPALAGWVHGNFGKFNHEFYEHVFELVLRLRGNYLWPAMWGRAFYDDDPENPKLANEYGIVIGTSHHEPMMRAHVEWERYGSGAWNYEANELTLREFWAEGVRRMGSNESVVTIGMRGDGDMPMTEGANIALLERIVADQRKIISEVTGRDPATVPQMWALYKEVQEYYDKGMRVPDDVMLLLCDDNWGNIRKLPKLNEPKRSGGYGIYYHFDYVGGPRNYKWLNTNSIPRVWEQMRLAYEYGANRLWIVNVGDIKPMEFPTEFFLDYAWNPDKWPADRLADYTRLWAKEQFGTEHAGAIADILAKYTKYNARRKPEMLSLDTYSLTNYREAETVVADYDRLVQDAERVNQQLAPQYKDAYFQLVLYPVKACANLNAMYVAAGQNHLYAQQGRAATNALADRVQQLFDYDADLARYGNRELADGKWNHMYDQTHIGYTYWQEPPQNSMPEVERIDLPSAAEMGVAIEGSEKWWPDSHDPAMLPELGPHGQRSAYFEVFNRGREPFQYTAEAAEPWVTISPTQGTVDQEQRAEVTVKWNSTPPGVHRVPITITGPNHRKVVVCAVIDKPAGVRADVGTGFVEAGGYVSMEAEHYSRAVDVPSINWLRVPDLGRTLSGVTISPATAASQSPGGDAPRLEYDVNLKSSGDVKVHAYVSPTLNFQNTEGLRYAVSFDDQPPQIVNIHEGENLQLWEKWVGENINETVTNHSLARPGRHVLKFWMVDPGIVLQKLVIDTGGMKPSYLGPSENTRLSPVPASVP